MTPTAVFLFILILIILVIVHEFGHFITAKMTKMRVDEFAFGFPPKVFGKKIGETTYSFNAIPLGGYVSIWGENGTEEDKKEGGALKHPRAFGNRPWWAQLIVLVAGVTMNMLLALVIFITLSFGTVTVSTNDPVYGPRVREVFLMVEEVSPESPAFKAGIVPGSIITSIKNNNKEADIRTATSVVAFIEKNSATPFTITYTTPDGVAQETTIAAVYGIVKDKKALGIGLETVGKVRTTPVEAIFLGFERTVTMTVLTVDGLGQVVASLFKGESVIDTLSGPVGIAKIVGQTSEYGTEAIATLVAILSINLAIFNILPLPALDGGRMVVVLIETISRKKIPFKYYSWVNMVGFLALITLLIIVTINDIRI